MTDAATTELTEFFNYLWGEEPVREKPTYVYLPVEMDGTWKSYMFEWPRQRAGVVKHVLKWNGIRANVFFSPALFAYANPKKENVLGSFVLWVDFDGNAPKEWPREPDSGGMYVPAPTLVVQSSIEGHEHCYWRLDTFLDDVALLEDRNRAIAYVMHADTSGWDADQILRPIRTTNHKRNKPVVIKSWEL